METDRSINHFQASSFDPISFIVGLFSSLIMNKKHINKREVDKNIKVWNQIHKGLLKHSLVLLSCEKHVSMSVLQKLSWLNVIGQYDKKHDHHSE